MCSSFPKKPWDTSLGGRGDLPRWWPMRKRGLWGAAAPSGPNTSRRGQGVLPKRWSALKEGLRVHVPLRPR